MPLRRSTRAPYVVPFAHAKYGRPLLIDAGYVSTFPRFEQDGRPHVLDFHDILLITRGSGLFLVDDESHVVEPGALFFTRPGQVRQWHASRLEGACIFFRDEFVVEAFSDPRFLDRFAYFGPTRPAGAVVLTTAQRRAYLRRFDSMRREIAALRSDAGHALRAGLYELLVLLHRFYLTRHAAGAGIVRNDLVDRFRALVDGNFRRTHRVAEYAGRLRVSPGHLNALCQASLRKSAGACVRERLVLEARRLLYYTDLTSAQIAYSLGFDDPSYFVRFFKRETGHAPIGLRRRQRRMLS